MSIPTQMSLVRFVAGDPDLHFTTAGAEYLRLRWYRRTGAMVIARDIGTDAALPSADTPPQRLPKGTTTSQIVSSIRHALCSWTASFGRPSRMPRCWLTPADREDELLRRSTS